TPRFAAALLALALMLAAAPTFAADGKVNVNQASADQLTMLPRVGPAIAERILEFRKENGPFKNVDDLLLVRGIGEKTLDLMKPYVSLSGETTLKEKVRSSRPAASDEG
ncbi:MAG: helix-hairpin-helix domain-containing protein, partial [Acidobacteria bacterium]|nr:helix-hairpin-helix domain-containing protein [Acidobacteriota bacterium]